MKLGGVSLPLAQIAGIRHFMPGLGRQADVIIERAIAHTARRMNARITNRWEARGKRGSAMRYIGLVLRGA